MLLKQDKRITIENVPKKSTVTIMDSKKWHRGVHHRGCERLWAGHAVVEVNVLGEGGAH